VQLPAALVQVIVHCLERNPEDRPASAADLRRELLPLAGTGPLDNANDIPLESQEPSATMLRDEPTIRVRCFQYRGPEDTSYLGEGVAEELIDTLSRTRGLRVIAGASTGDEESTNQDGPLALIVNGRVERQGNRFRIVVRLINARTETQLWTDVFSAEFADLFAAQEQIAQRVAEALRLEFETAARHDRIPQESVELYLRARQQARLDKYLGDDGAIALLERSLVLAPGLRPAMAWRALAMARSFWDSRVPSELTLAEVEEQVTVALQHAGTQAESHLAAAILAGQSAQYAQSVKHLTATLEVAPTCGTAHYYLGEMQCNTGRLLEGEERLRLAMQLDPSLRYAEFPLLRQYAFRGNWAPVEKALAAHQAASSHVDGAMLSTFLRMAMWAHRDEWLSPITRWAKIAGGQHYYEFFNNAVSYLRAPTEAASFDAAVRTMAASMESIRFRSLLYQLLAEAHACTGEEDLALLALEEAVGRHAFIDIDWMERSPSTLHFRTDARFLRLVEIVRERAESIWTVM
jgi:serine/threonine-protein kinase